MRFTRFRMRGFCSVSDREDEEKQVKKVLLSFGLDESTANQIITRLKIEGLIAEESFGDSVKKAASMLMNEVKITLVPVEVFGTDSYGLMDAVSAWSDCNRAIGQIYRRDEEEFAKHRKPDDVITVYVPRSELWKFDRKAIDT